MKSSRKRKLNRSPEVDSSLPPCDGGGMAMFIEDDGILAAIDEQAAKIAPSAQSIDQIIQQASKGDREALQKLRTLDIASLSDEDFKKLLPWMSLSDADLISIINLIDNELQSIDGKKVSKLV